MLFVNIEEIRDHCLAKPGVKEVFPFGQDVLVFKVIMGLFYTVIMVSSIYLGHLV